MISAGKTITSASDKLVKTTVEQLYKSLVKPKPHIADLVEQLRTLLIIDTNAYRRNKTQLPYVVPSLFNPPFRKKDNFASAQHLILDLDHLEQIDTTPDELKNKLASDEHIELMFVSPSGNGLKIFFRLAQKCHDPVKYSLFYKNFALKFAAKHSVQNVIDTVTSDVTRACFVSVDAKAFYNPEPVPLKIDDFIDFDDIFLLKNSNKIIKKAEKQQKKTKSQVPPDILEEIRKRLNPNLSKRIERKAYIPPKLNEIISDVEKYIISYGLNINEIVNINYGKKIIVSLQDSVAEVNLFYGKRGFTVVRSPKNGTDPKLMETLYSVVVQFFNEFNQKQL